MARAGAVMNIPQQANVEVPNQAVHCWASSPYLSAITRLQLARGHQDQYDWLDSEFANLRGCQAWLATQDGTKEVLCWLRGISVPKQAGKELCGKPCQ